MICVGIDVAKDKHDCFILSSEGEVLADVFTIPNNAEGFDTLLQTIRRCARPADKIKVGLEATGHYSYNILGFLLDNGLPTYRPAIALLHAFPLSGVAAPLFSASVGSPASSLRLAIPFYQAQAPGRPVP